MVLDLEGINEYVQQTKLFTVSLKLHNVAIKANAQVNPTTDPERSCRYTRTDCSQRNYSSGSYHLSETTSREKGVRVLEAELQSQARAWTGGAGDGVGLSLRVS